MVLVAPLCEEIVYRGLLWGGVERLGAGRWVAFVVTTLLFALAHFEFTRTPLLLVVAIPIALARLYTGRLLASIVAHQINNLLPGDRAVLGLLGVTADRPDRPPVRRGPARLAEWPIGPAAGPLPCRGHHTSRKRSP